MTLAFLLGKNRALPETTDSVIQFKFPALEQVLDIKPDVNVSRWTIGTFTDVSSPIPDSHRNRATTVESEYELNKRTPSVYNHF